MIRKKKRYGITYVKKGLRGEWKPLLYDEDSSIITYAHCNGFFHSQLHWVKWILDFGPLCNPMNRKPEFGKTFQLLIKGGVLTPIKKDKVMAREIING